MPSGWSAGRRDRVVPDTGEVRPEHVAHRRVGRLRRGDGGAGVGADRGSVLVALVIGGASWLLCLSTLNASMQLSLPSWVRARGLSVYQLIFMGGQAIGSVVWGVLAGATTVSSACW